MRFVHMKENAGTAMLSILHKSPYLEDMQWPYAVLIATMNTPTVKLWINKNVLNNIKIDGMRIFKYNILFDS